ncbi:RNA polymerase sigma-70 factor, ECF subfamily [Saccharicrinis carchari]|uniref:RNA polymerase sigma-70 factor, ECF subfamily n=1 Tax=Saccharicrinis carchari TaxID=1168039 RepID=A0A521EI22_SACCC|nr:RNA polymerase sigma-70 factor [Saccharicrinis carchari]SMO83502.1 RNA polymerase sigma-70 factor, ECF subfamily [Saccharicrinis carchari]
MKKSRENTDKQLLIQIAHGDRNAFRALFDAYYHFAFERSCLYCSFHDAQEVVSDVFAKIWNNKERLKEVSSFKGYLFMSIKNQSLNYLRKKNINTTDIENVFDHPFLQESNPHHQMELKELSEKVEEVIGNLPPKCKQAFKLVREDGLKYKDAAKAMSISENTLDVHLKKATKLVLEVVKKYSKVLIMLLMHPI